MSPGNVAASATFTRSTLPTLTITTTDTDIREGESVDFDIVFSEAVTGFTDTDITVTGGTRGTLTETDSENYVLSVTAGAGAGTITLAIAENVVNEGNAAASATFTRSTLATITITTTDTDIREGEVVSFNIAVSEAVTGFTASDVTVSGGTRGALTGSGDTYVLSVTAGVGSGMITISIPQNAVIPPNAAASSVFAYTGFPTIAITTTDTDIRENEAFNVDINFTESVTNFAVGDITVTGASVNGLTGSGASYDLSLTADAGAGNIVVSIAENVVSPGNVAAAATFTRSALGAVSITTTDPTIYEGETFTTNITFPESVTGFAVSDITITGGTLGTLTGSGDTYAIPVTAGTVRWFYRYLYSGKCGVPG